MAKKKIDLEESQRALNVPEPGDSERLKSQEGDLNAVNIADTSLEDLSKSELELQKELRRFLIPKLRSASYRWKFRSEAIKRARVERGRYQCAICNDKTLKNKEFIVDHVEPVVPLSGWDGLDWNVYITRMFCNADNFQILCKPCSEVKTDTETQIRKMYRQKKKENG